MQISRPYTVVLPSLQVDPSEREFDGRRFYLMIKLYPEGTLTPTLNPVVAGEFHNFQHSPSVLGGLLPPWGFKSKTMYLKLWLTLRKIKWNEGIFWNFPCWRKSVLMMKNWYICLVPLFLSFSCHTLQWGAPTFFQATLTIANVKVFFIWSWFISSHSKKCSWRKFSLLKFFLSTANFPKFVYNLHNFVSQVTPSKSVT